MTRCMGRKPDELRVWKISRGVLNYAEVSALVEAGNTRVLCSSSIEDRVPPCLKNGGSGWVTAEYSMLPRATHTRSPRERGNRLSGRTFEIQRMIGRSLRCVTLLRTFGERTVTVDCDVIQADGGTRVASVTAAWVALHDAFDTLIARGEVPSSPLTDSIAGVSVGVVDGKMVLDLDYDEDSRAEVDMNVVMTGRGSLVEVQATAEGLPFSVSRMNALVRLAYQGLKRIAEIQARAVAEPWKSS